MKRIKTIKHCLIFQLLFILSTALFLTIAKIVSITKAPPALLLFISIVFLVASIAFYFCFKDDNYFSKISILLTIINSITIASALATIYLHLKINLDLDALIVLFIILNLASFIIFFVPLFFHKRRLVVLILTSILIILIIIIANNSSLLETYSLIISIGYLTTISIAFFAFLSKEKNIYSYFYFGQIFGAVIALIVALAILSEGDIFDGALFDFDLSSSKKKIKNKKL